VQIPAAESTYAPPSANFQENNQDDSFMQTPAGDSEYVPPYASAPANDQDDPFEQIFTAENGYTSPDPLITPPQSSHDMSLPLESSEDIDDSNVRGHRRPRRIRTRTVDPVEGRREVDHNSRSRKIRRKH